MDSIRGKILVLWAVFLAALIAVCFAKEVPVNIQQNVKPQAATAFDPLKEKISVDYKDVNIADILSSLSYTYGLNLVTSTEVKGKVTISLKDVFLNEALEAILSANGYNYSQKGNILYISPGPVEGAQIITEPVTLKYFKAVDAQNLVRKMLSPKGDIKVDEVANMLVITDYQASIEKVKELLKIVDQPPRQVLIEAKIVDITSKDLKNMGVTWQMDYNPSHGIFGRGTETAENLKITQSLPGTSSLLSSGQFNLDNLVLKGITASATIDALVQAQKAHLLASPSIAVLNNREARIIIGEKVPYKERTQTTTGTTETTRFIDVGTTLRVTPSINADGYITIAIHPEVSSVKALLDAGPQITTREADTIVRVKEGETIVIGGLIKQEDNRTRSRVPILGYIPILEYLFSSKSTDQTQTELAVFITPKILLSRAERLTENKTLYEEEAYVNIMSTANLNVQAKLFEKAKNLQLGLGLEADNKDEWQRKNQALSIYEYIFTQFPDGPKAPESGYQAAVLYNELGEYYLANAMCAKIISNHPGSAFAPKAKRMQRAINEYLKAEPRKKAEIKLNKVIELPNAEQYQSARLQDEEPLKAPLLEEELPQGNQGQEAKVRVEKEARQKAKEEAIRQKKELRGEKAAQEERKRQQRIKQSRANEQEKAREKAREKEKSKAIISEREFQYWW